MTDSPHAPCDTPRNRTGITPAGAMAVIAGATVAKLAYFVALERPLGCDCGRIWAMPGGPHVNSLVALDPYTLLHLVFGALLALGLMALRPRWTLWALMAAVVFSSTVWELVENLPPVVDAFNYDQGDPLAYRGDSLLNASADTAAAVLGAGLARLGPTPPILAAAAAIEIALSAWIGDGFVIATWRALAGLA